MCSVSGVPLQIDPRDDKSYVPEQYPLKVNGPLPEGVSVIQGYCENCTMYPEENSVSAFSSSSKQDYRIASEAEIKAHTFYTALSANAYCRTVIPGGRWSCPHCGVASNLQITKTFSTLITDTNVLVAVGEKEKTIYVVFRGTSSIRNAIAVSSPLTNRALYCSSTHSFLQDIVFVPVNYPPVNGAKVHKGMWSRGVILYIRMLNMLIYYLGFLDSYNEVQDKLVAEVKAQLDRHPGYKIVVTG